MLHQGILPHHTKWARFFENLGYVVIDEMHTYRGVFGSHVANLLRRLRRVCRFYDSDPVFILCSATIANPGQLAEELIGNPVELVNESGAPCGQRTLLLWNPPVVNPELGIRASARSQTTRIARHAVSAGLKTIVFARTRLMVELLTRYLKDTFDSDPRRAPRVRAYRGGYLPGERRETERALRGGAIDCVVATSALELGVDIGSLDVAVLNGYPGTVAATSQRLGRAGRRNRPAVGVLVASSDPLDQYLVRNPEFFLSASPESALIDPKQLLIRLDHIRCAAFELPFGRGERFDGEDPTDFLDYLREEGVLHPDGDRWHWVADSYPANSVSLRSVAEGNFVVIDLTGGGQSVIAEVDYFSAPLTLYEGAIVLVQARPWQVERLDWKGRKAFVTQTRADYYTEAVDYTRLRVLERAEQASSGQGACCRGDVHVVVRVAGYKKIRYYTHENVGYGDVSLPDQELQTSAVWWRLPAATLEEVFPNRWRALGGFLGAAHALHFAATFLCMAAHQDLGRCVGDGQTGEAMPVTRDSRAFSRPTDELSENRRFEPSVFLYDRYPGGIGLATRVFDQRGTVLTSARELVQGCTCRHGCPACVGPVLEDGDGGTPTTRVDALTVLGLLHDQATNGFGC
jgi:DEAD/DEAH box helicase domain-containing protein